MLKIILAALAYIIPTMPYGYLWHMAWFKKQYERWQYFGGDASIPLGFTSMIIQGIILSVTYSLLRIEHASYINALLFSGIMGAFFWSTHVVSAMAKHGATRTKGYFFLETIYLAGQFAVFGILLGVIYSNL
jgi:hypothetical protein